MRSSISCNAKFQYRPFSGTVPHSKTYGLLPMQNNGNAAKTRNTLSLKINYTAMIILLV
jgi:hypothetical protein